MKTLKVASIQMVSGMDVDANIQKMRHWVKEAALSGAKWVVLPEYWPIMGQHELDKVAYAETLYDGQLQTALSQIAKECQITLFAGSLPLKASVANKVRNSLLVFDEAGNCISHYDKMHLFGFTGLGEHYRESDSIEAGDIVPKLHVQGHGVAQGICYDLRFPEFFRAQAPFDVLILPAAFTYNTGKAHWQMLLQARAVENQCYVIASGQGGTHENGRRTFGHSMIINPWGEIIDCLPEGEGVVYADISWSFLNSVRSKLPALQHQLLDVPVVGRILSMGNNGLIR